MVIELTLNELLIAPVEPVKFTHALAEPLIQLVEEVLLVPSERVEIVSVPAMIYPYELKTEAYTLKELTGVPVEPLVPI